MLQTYTKTLLPLPDPGRTPLRAWGGLERLVKIGEGSFGEVYRAWDPRLEREVALKLKRPDSLDEGRLLARVRHPNVVTVHGADLRQGRLGIWMELVEGRTLAELLSERGPFGGAEATLIGLDLCRALAAVHRAGLVHLDVKSTNVMRERGGRIVLMDFGAGRELTEDAERTPARLSGTPLYMAPELFFGAVPTVESDLYSLGVLLYHLVSGSFPIEGETLADLRDAHRAGRVKPLGDRRPDLPEGFHGVVERATSREATARYRSAGAMESALWACLAASQGCRASAAGGCPTRLSVRLGPVEVAFSVGGAAGPPLARRRRAAATAARTV